jgi:uridine kinase
LEPKTIITPLDISLVGKERIAKVCGVSVVRAGVAMEKALRSVEKDIEIGKLLIQTEPKTGEPQLHYCKLPHDIGECKVLLMDASVGTGASALMAIRVLLDHHVKERDIIFCCLIATRQGIHSINRAFPFVTVVTSEIELGLDEKLHVIPGLGNFGGKLYDHSLP